MKWLFLTILLIGPINQSMAGVCEKKYPPIKTLVTKPVKVAYTVIVKMPYKATKRCLKKGFKDIKKKLWKIISKPYTFWAECAYTAYKDIKEKRYREELKEVEELKDTPEFFKCIAKEKDFKSALKAALLLNGSLGGIFTNVALDNLFVSKKISKTSFSEKNLHNFKKTFTVISRGRALTYQTLFRGKVSMDITEEINSRETAISKRTSCSHKILQTIKWTNPCLVDNRPIHQYEENPDLSFTCKEDFQHSKIIDRGLEPGKEGDTLYNNDDCGKIYSYIMGKFAKEKVKLNQIMEDQISAISNIQFISLSNSLQGDGNE